MKELLIVESDGLVVRAAVIQKSGKGNVRLRAYTESRQVDLPEALRETVAGIDKAGVKPPMNAILLDSHVYTTILSLPVDPAKQLLFNEMQELVRWELEPYMAQSRVRRLGSILEGRGYLTNGDVKWVMEFMEKENKRMLKSSSDKKLPRFGETALRLGLISHEQLEESLMLQQPLQEPEGEIVCGWTPLAEKSLNGRWRWLVSGVAVSFRESAVQSFAQAGIHLQAMYSNVGTAGASLNGQMGNTCGVFEFQAGTLGYTRLTAGRTVTARFHFNDDRANLVNLCLELLEGDVENLWLAGRWPDIDGAAGEITVQAGRPCQKIPVQTKLSSLDESDPWAFAGMIGAFRHFLKLVSLQTAVYVPANLPPTPLNQYKYYRQGVVLLLVAVLGGLGGKLYQSKSLHLTKLTEATGKLEETRVRINKLETEIKDLRQKKAFLSEKLPQREAMIPYLMKVLQSAMSQEIMLNSFYEDDEGIIHIEGWGLSIRAIQIFKLDISKCLERFRLNSQDYPIQEKKGWRDIHGYSFRFDLVPDGISTNAPSPRNKGGTH